MDSMASSARVQKLTLRPKRPEDEPFVTRLSAGAFAPYSEEPAASVRRMLRDPSAYIEIADLDGEAVGFVVVELWRLGRSVGPLIRPAGAHLAAVAVVPARRRRGLGRLLAARAEEVARAFGAQSISLMTAATNRTARRLFERAGYQCYASVVDAYAAGQRGVLMIKVLG
jgi:ribosomal protein S18 acetylase RimI-like enzyme